MNAKHNHNGFTIIEIVVFIMVTGILLAVVGVKIADYNLRIDLDRAARQVLSDVRYAQEMAMSSNRGVDFNISGSSYNLTWTSGGTLTSTFNNGSVAGNVSEFNASLLGSSFSFTRNGLPSSAITLTVSNSSGSRTIQVNATTGFSLLN